jgi:hypothetical protein
MAYAPVVAPPPPGAPMLSYAQPQGAAATAPPSAASYATHTALLLNFAGADGGVTITDSGQYGRAVSVFGNAKISTAQSKFGGSSLVLDGTGDYLTVGESPLWSAGANYSIEAFIRPANVSSIRTILGTRPAATVQGWILALDASGRPQFVGWDAGGSLVINVTTSASLTLNTWAHVEVTRYLGTWRLFLDGTPIGSGVESAPLSYSSLPLIIGRDLSNTLRDFHGHMDALRIRHGVAQHTAAFTPPAVEPTD